MDKFQDVFECEPWLQEAKGKDPKFLGTLVFPWGKSDTKNKNGRTYPHEVLSSAVKALNDRIKASPVPGMADHPPQGSGTQLSGVSHILTKVWLDKDKVARAEAKILPTQKGKDALTVIKSNVRIGASLRGYGQVDKAGTVKPGVDIRGVDLVVDPSFGANATITQQNVFESESYMPESAEPDSGKDNKDNSQDNKPEDVEGNKDEQMSDKLKTSEELKVAYPDFTKALEDAAVEANKVDVEKVVTEKIEAAKKDWKKEVTEELEKKLTAMSEKVEQVFEVERKHVAALCEIEGFIEDETEEEKAEREKKAATVDSKLGKVVEEVKSKNTELEKELKDMKDADQKEKDDKELQKNLKEALDAELDKKDNKQYKALIEKQLVDEDGKISIEKVEDVETAVTDTKKKLSEIFVDAKKAKIVEGGLDEVGLIEDPEGKETKEVSEEVKTQKAHFKEAVDAGFEGTFQQWKEKNLKKE